MLALPRQAAFSPQASGIVRGLMPPGENRLNPLDSVLLSFRKCLHPAGDRPKGNT